MNYLKNLQYKMFLLNPEKIDQVKEAVGVFTIQNVPIKS